MHTSNYAETKIVIPTVGKCVFFPSILRTPNLFVFEAILTPGFGCRQKGRLERQVGVAIKLLLKLFSAKKGKKKERV